MDKIKVIYIGTVGHSGSTLLDLMISASDNIVSVGEVSNYDIWKRNNLLCTCDKKFKNCTFWDSVISKLPENFKLTDKSPNKFSNYINIAPFDNEFLQNYNRATYDLFQGVLEVSGSDFLIDSSKSLARLKCLVQNPKFDVYFIHLIKDGRMVAKSLTKPKRKMSYSNNEYTKKINFFKGFLSWVLINRQTDKFLQRNKKNLKSIQLRYEDLVLSPKTELDRISQLIGVNLLCPSNNTFPVDDNHNIGGSRFRYDKQIKVKPKFDTYSLSIIEKVFSLLIGKRVLSEYNYIEKR